MVELLEIKQISRFHFSIKCHSDAVWCIKMKLCSCYRLVKLQNITWFLKVAKMIPLERVFGQGHHMKSIETEFKAQTVDRWKGRFRITKQLDSRMDIPICTRGGFDADKLILRIFWSLRSARIPPEPRAFLFLYSFCRWKYRAGETRATSLGLRLYWLRRGTFRSSFDLIAVLG